MKRLLHFNLNRRVNTFILSLLISVLPFSQLFSNNLAVSIVSVNQPVSGNIGTVTFNLSWDNSWHDLGTVAKNWDAAWVFVKWKDCTVSSNTQFTHGLVSTTVSDHIFSGSTTLEPTLADGTAAVGGSIDAAPNNTGVMLRTAAAPAPYGPVSAQVTLTFTNMPNTTQVPALNVKAFGIEMVFVSSATYFLGDGNGTIKSTNSFALAVGNSTDVSITSEGAQTVFESTSTFCPSGVCALSAAFPKGFGPFYMMKYEISQGAYCDFLNTLPALAQSIHYTATSGVSPWNYTATAGNRHTINMTQQATGQYLFTVDRPYRACNFLSWSDVSAYLAWAALRPLTELEYEKACRGTINAIPYETAYGQTTGSRAVTISGAEGGSEVISSPAGANICAGAGGVAFTSGDNGTGPIRGGIFATAANSTRLLNGSSFYGVMELSGNVDEYYVSAQAGAFGQLYSGPGMLVDSTGNFNTALGWPHPLFPSSNGNTSNDFLIRKGGNWNTTIAFPSALSVSQRASGTSIARDNTSGGRGGRSNTGSAPNTTNSQTFFYTGALQTFTVPTGVTSIVMDVRGAQGGNGGGLGGVARGILTVAPAQVLNVYVGQQGQNTAGGTNGGASTGGNGGGASSYGGGAASEVRRGGTALANRIIIAGGGGGQSGGGTGGGGTVGTTGSDLWAGGAGGSGNTNPGNNGGSAGGATVVNSSCSASVGVGGSGGGYTSGGGGGSASCNQNGTAGSQSAGGNGGGSTAAGGGGGGHWGGGGGGSYTTAASSGGGGSSAVLGGSSTWTNVSFAGGVQGGNGRIIFYW